MANKKTASNATCALCRSSETDILNYGEMYTVGSITCHHFCLLFSAYLPQNGSDSQGIQGFLMVDIKRELVRCSKTMCCYCGKSGAASLCQSLACSRTFHLSCGVKHKALLSFIGRFCVTCSDHRPSQKCIPRDASEPCSICMEPNSADMLVTICTPCCGHLFHKACLQRMALSSAYFFTCPTCRNRNARSGFLRHMKRFGVFIPHRDASWETSGSFSELLDRPQGCTQRYCLCNEGRLFMSKNKNWRMLMCNACGSSCAHYACTSSDNFISSSDQSESERGRLTSQWLCDDCVCAYDGLPDAVRRYRRSRPTLRQLLCSGESGERPRTLCNALGGKLTFSQLICCVEDPRTLLRFLIRGDGQLRVFTQRLIDPLWPDHTIHSVAVSLNGVSLWPEVRLRRLEEDLSMSGSSALCGSQLTGTVLTRKQRGRNSGSARRKQKSEDVIAVTSSLSASSGAASTSFSIGQRCEETEHSFFYRITGKCDITRSLVSQDRDQQCADIGCGRQSQNSACKRRSLSTCPSGGRKRCRRVNPTNATLKQTTLDRMWLIAGRHHKS